MHFAYAWLPLVRNPLEKFVVRRALAPYTGNSYEFLSPVNVMRAWLGNGSSSVPTMSLPPKTKM